MKSMGKKMMLLLFEIMKSYNHSLKAQPYDFSGFCYPNTKIRFSNNANYYQEAYNNSTF